jgi:hypothetical protein
LNGRYHKQGAHPEALHGLPAGQAPTVGVGRSRPTRLQKLDSRQFFQRQYDDSLSCLAVDRRIQQRSQFGRLAAAVTMPPDQSGS